MPGFDKQMIEMMIRFLKTDCNHGSSHTKWNNKIFDILESGNDQT